jgi:hypothetical protein
MCAIEDLLLVVEELSFRKYEYSDAESQLSDFANRFVELDPNSADQLRECFDSKVRLGLFRTASSLFRHSFPTALGVQKARLLRIVFAMYSFDNLNFGYDSVLDVIDISKLLQDQERCLAKEAWLPFKKLTTNKIAQGNLENHLFGEIILPN